MAHAATQLQRAGHKITVGVLKLEGPLLSALREAGIPVVEFRKRRTLFSRAGIYQLLRLAAFIRREHFDVVHAHDLWSNLLGVPAAWLARTPKIIASRRYLADLDWYTPRRNRLMRLLYSLSTNVVVNSASVRDLLIRRDCVPAAKIRVVYNSVNVERFNSSEAPDGAVLEKQRRRSKYVAVVANMYSEVKGHGTLVLAARAVCRKFAHVMFLLIGDGRKRCQIEEQVKDLGLERNFLFLGSCADVDDILACCDLSVLPSEAEALPNSLLEAMAAGLPVVATRVGGTAEAIDDGVSGLLVPPKDPEAMATAILRILEQPELARSLARAAKETVRARFGLDRLIAELEQLYGAFANPAASAEPTL